MPCIYACAFVCFCMRACTFVGTYSLAWECVRLFVQVLVPHFLGRLIPCRIGIAHFNYIPFLPFQPHSRVPPRHSWGPPYLMAGECAFTRLDDLEGWGKMDTLGPVSDLHKGLDPLLVSSCRCHPHDTSWWPEGSAEEPPWSDPRVDLLS